MAEELLVNGDLQADWSEQKSHALWYTTDKVTWQQKDVENIFDPPGWTVWAQLTDGRVQPEGRDAWAKDDPDRALPGMLKGWVLFKSWGPWLGGLMQRVELPADVPDGATLELRLWAHAWTNHTDPQHDEWYHNEGNPNYSQGSLVGFNKIALTQAQVDAVFGVGEPDTEERVQNDANAAARFRVGWGLAPDPLKWTGFGDTLYEYNGYVQEITCRFTPTTRVFYVFLRANLQYGFQNNDAYFGGVSLKVIGEPEPPLPDPCEGKARFPYDGYTVLLPQDATAEEWATAFRAYEQRKTTFTLSADDAFIYAGKKSQTVAVLSAARWPDGKPGFEALRDGFYPAAKIIYDDATLGALPPIPEPPAGLNAYQRAGWTLAQKLLLWHGLKLARPNTFKEYAVTDGGEFGNNRGSYYHNGLDLRASWAAYGTEITCALAGTVEVASDVGQGFGVQVRTRSVVDGQTVYVRYAHLVSPPYIKIGDVLTTGQKIGKADSGGVSTGDHQHIDVWWADAGGYADPAVLLTPWKDEEPEPPEPPVGDRQARFGVVSAHVQAWDGAKLLDTYIPQIVPAVVKVFSLEDVRGVLARTNCQSRVVVRMARSAPQDPVTGPAEWIGYWGDGLRSTYAALQQEFGDALLPGSVLFEEANEWVGNDRAQNLIRRDWSLQYCEDLARLAPGWSPACFCTAVGNPPEEQYPDWTPVAQAVAHGLGALGYHAYWIANTDWERDWRWLQGRWAYMDTVFGGVCDWYLGESGVIEGYYYPDGASAMEAALDRAHAYPEAWMADAGDPFGPIRGRWDDFRVVWAGCPGDGYFSAASAGGSYWLNSGDDAGWRVKAYNGIWSLYERDWKEMVRRCRAFGPRCWGPTAYTVGPVFVHWESFKMRDPEWTALQPLMAAYPLG